MRVAEVPIKKTAGTGDRDASQQVESTGENAHVRVSKLLRLHPHVIFPVPCLVGPSSRAASGGSVVSDWLPRQNHRRVEARTPASVTATPVLPWPGPPT